MGGGNTKQQPINLAINHPVLNKANLVFVEGLRRIQVSVATDSKVYAKFVQNQNQKIYPELLMLPVSW